jgi:hypothetical protein
MLTFTKESTHFFIISNIWIATALLTDREPIAWFAGLFGLLWFIYGVYVSKKEKEIQDEIADWE